GSGGGSSAAGAALATRISIDHGTVTYVARGAGDRVAQYGLEGLDLKLTSSGTQIAFKGDARLLPGAVALKVTDGIVSLTPGRTLTDAPVRAKVAIDGKDIRDLTAVAVGPSPELGGAIKGSLTVAGTVALPTAGGGDPALHGQAGARDAGRRHGRSTAGHDAGSGDPRPARRSQHQGVAAGQGAGGLPLRRRRSARSARSRRRPDLRDPRRAQHAERSRQAARRQREGRRSPRAGPGRQRGPRGRCAVGRA